jgi:hypothetical protein
LEFFIIAVKKAASNPFVSVVSKNKGDGSIFLVKLRLKNRTVPFILDFELITSYGLCLISPLLIAEG